MPIFELPNTLSADNLPKPALGSPLIPSPYLPSETGEKEYSEGNSLDNINRLMNSPAKDGGFGRSFSSIPISELQANKRYPFYERGEDLENIYGLQQSALDRLANATVKMAATSVGTFAQSFATIPNTVSAIKNGKFQDLSNPDGYEASIDTWLKNIEDNFPNYYSRYEKQHPYLSMVPGFTGSANFWGDKVIKNLGFTAGAIAGAAVQDFGIGLVTEGVGEIPLVASQIGKASLYLNKLFTSANNLDRTLDLARIAGKTEKQILGIKELSQLSATAQVNNGFRYGAALYGSARTEAAIEARDGYNKVKEELVRQYKLDNAGENPNFASQQEIEDYATDAMNTRFGINMALLTVSNAVQFGNLFKSFGNTSKALSGELSKEIGDLGKLGLAKGSLDKFEVKVAEGFLPKVWDSVKPTIPNILSEGVYEEGGQYATEKGTYDYFTRKYKNLSSPNNKENWDAVNETINSTVKGLKEQFGSTEGIENMVVGAISALISGGIMGRVDNSRGQGKNDRLQSAVNILNQHGLTSILEKQYTDTLDSVGIAKDMDEAVKSNDIFKYKNLKDDMFFKFVMSRVPNNLHDVTLEQLQMLKSLPKEDFEKTFGTEFNYPNKLTVGEYVDSLINRANFINDTYKSIDFTFKNPFTNFVNPQDGQQVLQTQGYNTFNNWKTELTYLASRVPDINARLEGIQKTVSSLNDLVTIGQISQLTNKDTLRELAMEYEEQANSLAKTLEISLDKKKVRNDIKSLRTLSERINLAIKNKVDIDLFDKLLNFELNGRDFSKSKIIQQDKAYQLFNIGHDINRLEALKDRVSELYNGLSSEKGFEDYFKSAEKLAEQKIETPQEEAPKEQSPYEVGREYVTSVKPSTVKKIADDRWELASPSGSTFYKTKEEAEDAKKEEDENLKDLGKVKVLEVNPDNTVKIEDLSGNIYNIPKERLQGYNKLLTEQEKLQKVKNEINRQQKEIEAKSGNVSTNSPEEDGKEEDIEEKKKEANILFISTSSASQDWEANTLKPNIIRANILQNNFKNFPNKENIKVMLVTQKQENNVGLEGLADLAYSGSGISKEEYNNIDNGLIAAVYIEQKDNNVYFIDKDGKRLSKLGEKADLNEVVFSTMPSTSLLWNNGKPRYRSNQEEEAKIQQARWAKFREQVFSEESPKLYGFTISRGIPIVSDEEVAVGDNLVPKEFIPTRDNLIIIPTANTIFHNDNTLKFPNGRPVLHYEDTLQFLNNRNFTKNEALSIFEVLNSIAKELTATNKLNKEYITFIQNVLFWKTSKQVAGNQVFVDTDNMELSLGGNKYDITKLSDFKDEIVNTLQNAYNSINNTTLTKEFSNPFTEYYFDGSLKTIQWPNYQSYILSDKYPDGSKRSEIPLTTNVIKPSESVPYNYKQKYAILEGVPLPNIEAPKPIEKVEVKPLVVDNYVLDGVTTNTYQLKNGPVEFTGIVEDGNVAITVKSNDTIEKITNNKELVDNTIIPILKKADRFSEEWNPQEIVLNYVALRISSDLTAKLPKQPVQEIKIEGPSGEPKMLRFIKVDENSNYRIQGGETSLMIDEEIQLFKEWHQKNVPNIPYEILNNILYTHNNEKAWGVFENGVAKFYKKAAKGTEYHEIFEGVWKAFLTEDEKQAILNEFKARKGEFTDRETGKKIVFNEATDLQAKERIADDFADFRVGKIKARTIGEKIAKFFRDVINFFKEFVSKPSLKEQLFKAIDTGKFKESVIPDSVKNEFAVKKADIERRRQEELKRHKESTFFKDVQGQEIIEGVSYDDDYFDFRYKGDKYKIIEDKESWDAEQEMHSQVFTKNAIPISSEEYSKIYNKYEKSDEKFFQKGLTPEQKREINSKYDRELAILENREFSDYKKIGNLQEQQVNDIVEDVVARVFQIIFKNNSSLYNIENITSDEIFGEIKRNYIDAQRIGNGANQLNENEFSQIVDRSKEFLRTFKIEFDENNQLSINQEDRDKTLYAPEPFSTNWKKSSPFPVKVLIGTLTETVPTNQENSISLELPKQRLSSINGYKLLNFSRAFATLMDKLGNTTKVGDIVDKLLNLSKFDSNYVRLFNRLKGDRNTLSIDFSKFQPHDWRLFVNFYQTFSKQKPNAYIQYIKDGEVFTSPANLFTSVRQVQQGWIENIKNLSKTKKGIISYNKSEKSYQVGDISALPIKTPQDKVALLNKIGINFPLEVYTRLKDSEAKKFSDTVSAIRAYLGENKNILSITGKTLGVNSQLTSLAELLVKVTNPQQDITYFGLDGKRRQLFADNNAASYFENIFNSANTLDDLLNELPELKDEFSENSVILKKGGLFFDINGKRIKSLKVGYIQGTNNLDNGKESITQTLSLGARNIQEINQNLNGNYYILIPADSNTEWMLNLGNHVDFKDFEASDIDSGAGWNKIYTIFKGYLKDDVNLALNDRSYIKNIGNKAKQLRFFNHILSDKLLNKVSELLSPFPSQEEVDKFIEDNSEDINSSVNKYIQATVGESISLLRNNNEIVQIGENSNIFQNLDDNFVKTEKLKKNNLSDKEIQDIVLFRNTSYIINNIEFHKILFGDPYQFAIKNNQLDETKRIKSFLSPRRTTFHTPEYNSYLNVEYNKAHDISLDREELGYHIYKSFANTVIVDDIEVVGSASIYNKKFEKTNEADAASLIIDNSYREVKLKNGQWSDNAEAFHQWQMAYTRLNMPNYKYKNEALKEQDEKLVKGPEPVYVLDVLKPIVSGNKNNKHFQDKVLYKMSQMPLYYKAIEGTNLAKLYEKMWKEGKDYAVFISAAKVGAENLHNLYSEDGSLNKEKFNNNIEVPWSSYGIQVENAYDGPKEQTRGSQITKLSSLDLFDKGKASPKVQEEYNRNIDLLNKMHKNSYNVLLKKLGIEDLDGSFKLVDNKAIANTLEYEMLRRELSENAKDVVKLDENGSFRIPFEASTNYIQIRDILFSMVDKALISPKMSGGAHVQVPVTLWESGNRKLAIKTEDGYKKISSEEYKSLSEADKERVVFTDDTLKFYTKEDPYCEVLLPAWFKDKIKTKRFKSEEELLNHLNKSEEGRSILKGVGFRIPTQSQSSIEVVKVKGFLPDFMGRTVVVPSEITTKAGSDFDIDKLNMYLKAVYLDENNNIKLVKYKGSEEATRNFYKDIYESKIQKQIDKIGNFDEFRNTLLGIFTTIESMDKVTLEGIEFLLGQDDFDFYNRYFDVISSINDQAYEENLQPSEYLQKQIDNLSNKKSSLTKELLNSELKNRFVDDMYKYSLQNEYYDSLEKLITLPENFDRLISPVDDAGLKKLSDKLDRLKGNDETSIKNRILNPTYMLSQRHAFLAGKKWVGIAAVNITGQSLTQKANIFVDPGKIALLPDSDRKFLKDGAILLPHNEDDSKSSISGTTTYDGKQFISERLSGYATAFVDVAKDPYILKIIKNDLVVGVFMTLERFGVGENTAYFMNQPIIDRYLSYLDSIGSRSLFSQKNIDMIKSEFLASKKQIQDAKIDPSKFEANIEKFHKKGKFDSDTDNAEQQLILDEFLKYAKIAEQSFELTQAANYDTTSFRSSDALFRKQVKTQKAREANIFSSVDKLLTSSFIGDQSYLLSYSTEAMGEILKLDRYEYKDVSNSVLRPYAANKYLSADKYETIGNKLTASFLDYIIQTKSGINDEIKPLLVETSSSVASQLAIAKQSHPQLRILQDLEQTSDNTGREEQATSIRLKVNLKDSYDENLYTDMMRELRATIPSLYNNIVKLAILQGTYQSAISIKNIIPIEDYAKIVAPIIEQLSDNQDLEEFKNGWFQRNNWKDDTIFRTVNPKFFPSEVPIGMDQYGNEIYQYFSPSFPNIEKVGIQSKDRRVLMLSEKYNFLDVSSDFVLVPRVVRDNKTGASINMDNGQTVTKVQFAQRKAKGDTSLKDVFGYKKVKLDDSTPLIVYDNKGNAQHVYKLINLYGDGQYASEYYTSAKPSVLNNGTVKVDNEIPDEDIIAYYSLKSQKSTVPLPIVSETKVIATNVITPVDALKTFDFGKKEGTPQTKAANDIIHNNIINNPDKPMANEGESFNEAVNRLIPEITNILNNAPKNSIVVTHNSIYGLIKIWDKSGRPNSLTKEQREAYVKQDNTAPPGSHFTIQGKNTLLEIIRHGETADNLAGVFRRSDTELTEKGIKEALEVGRELSNKVISKVYASPLSRTLHTAELILSEQKNKEDDSISDVPPCI